MCGARWIRPELWRRCGAAHLFQHTEYCVGLDLVLEAVQELPPNGLSIPASAQSRMRQFFTEQLSADTLPQRWRPQDLQDIKQLKVVLQHHAMLVNDGSDAALQAIPMEAATAQLVADAVRQVARQQVVEKTHGLMGCCWMRATEQVGKGCHQLRTGWVACVRWTLRVCSTRPAA